MQQKITLIAGKEYRQPLNSSKFTTFLILSTGAAESLEFVQFEAKGQTLERLNNVTKGLKVRSAIGFDAILFLSAVDADVQIVTSPADISVSQVDGATINANITAWPADVLHVSNDRGSAPESPLYVVSSSTAQASALINAEPVTVSDTVTVIAAANTARLSLRITNLGPNPVAVGGAGLTWAMRCIVLDEGGSWVEDAAAGLAWYAITDTGKTASIAMQEVVS